MSMYFITYSQPGMQRAGRNAGLGNSSLSGVEKGVDGESAV